MQTPAFSAVLGSELHPGAQVEVLSSGPPVAVVHSVTICFVFSYEGVSLSWFENQRCVLCNVFFNGSCVECSSYLNFSTFFCFVFSCFKGLYVLYQELRSGKGP